MKPKKKRKKKRAKLMKVESDTEQASEVEEEIIDEEEVLVQEIRLQKQEQARQERIAMGMRVDDQEGKATLLDETTPVESEFKPKGKRKPLQASHRVSKGQQKLKTLLERIRARNVLRRGVQVIESKRKFDIRAALKGMRKVPITAPMLIVEPLDKPSSSKSDGKAIAPAAAALPIDDERYDADEETENGNAFARTQSCTQEDNEKDSQLGTSTLTPTQIFTQDDDEDDSQLMIASPPRDTDKLVLSDQPATPSPPPSKKRRTSPVAETQGEDSSPIKRVRLHNTSGQPAAKHTELKEEQQQTLSSQRKRAGASPTQPNLDPRNEINAATRNFQQLRDGNTEEIDPSPPKRVRLDIKEAKTETMQPTQTGSVNEMAETTPDHQDGDANPNSVADLPVKAPSDYDISIIAGMKNENNVDNGKSTQETWPPPQRTAAKFKKRTLLKDGSIGIARTQISIGSLFANARAKQVQVSCHAPNKEVPSKHQVPKAEASKKGGIAQMFEHMTESNQNATKQEQQECKEVKQVHIAAEINEDEAEDGEEKILVHDIGSQPSASENSTMDSQSSVTLSQLTQSQSFEFAQKVDSLAAAVFDEEAEDDEGGDGETDREDNGDSIENKAGIFHIAKLLRDDDEAIETVMERSKLKWAGEGTDEDGSDQENDAQLEDLVDEAPVSGDDEDEEAALAAEVRAGALDATAPTQLDDEDNPSTLTSEAIEASDATQHDEEDGEEEALRLQQEQDERIAEQKRLDEESHQRLMKDARAQLLEQKVLQAEKGRKKRKALALDSRCIAIQRKLSRTNRPQIIRQNSLSRQNSNSGFGFLDTRDGSNSLLTRSNSFLLQRMSSDSGTAEANALNLQSSSVLMSKGYYVFQKDDSRIRGSSRSSSARALPVKSKGARLKRRPSLFSKAMMAANAVK